MESMETWEAVEEHLAAFNRHDTAAVLAGVAPDVVWSTGVDTFYGRNQLTDLFDDWLWNLSPRLEVRRSAVNGEFAAAECTEHLINNGENHSLPIAIFFTVRSGLLQSVKVYREGSAAID